MVKISRKAIPKRKAYKPPPKPGRRPKKPTPSPPPKKEK